MPDTRAILIADDHAPTVRLCGEALQAEGHVVFRATSFEEAERHMASGEVGCVVLDAGLDGGDLTAFCRAIHGRVRIVLLEPPRMSTAVRAQTAPFVASRLVKPFRVEELVACVRPQTGARYKTAAETHDGAVVREVTSRAPADLVGTTIGGCRVDRLLGRGSTGEVYLAQHLTLDVPVAVKVIRTGPPAGGETNFERFLRGARAAARVQHPHIVAVLHAGKEEGRCFLIQRYVKGDTLRKIIEEQGGPSEKAILRCGIEIASGLAAVHREGIIHRDVKPANIIVTASGASMLSDFGFAREFGRSDISSSTAVLGTPFYMPPEQWESGALDGRSDLYSLGATLYHALTGRPPITGETALAVLRGHMAQTPTPPKALRPGLAKPFSDAVLRALAKRPADRYASAEEFGETLRKITLSA